MALLESRQFELASREFHYSSSYTSDELAADQATIATNLSLLFREIGNLQGAPKYMYGLKLTAFFGIRGGDKAHPSPELDNAETINIGYDVQVQREGACRITLILVRLGDRWRVREFRLGLPAQDAGAMARVKDIAERVVNDGG